MNLEHELLEGVRTQCDEEWRVDTHHSNIDGELAVVVVRVIPHEDENLRGRRLETPRSDD